MKLWFWPYTQESLSGEREEEKEKDGNIFFRHCSVTSSGTFALTGLI